MTVQIRNNIFETNSSSTHSICVTKNDILNDKRKYLYFSLGEFGWEYDTLSSVENKASYLYTALVELKLLDLLEKVKSILTSNCVECEFEEPELVKSNYSDYTYLDSGYVDHTEDLPPFLEEICSDENKLMRFLFSNESFIITGNDNDETDVNIDIKYDHDEYYKGN